MIRDRLQLRAIPPKPPSSRYLPTPSPSIISPFALRRRPSSFRTTKKDVSIPFSLTPYHTVTSLLSCILLLYHAQDHIAAAYFSGVWPSSSLIFYSILPFVVLLSVPSSLLRLPSCLFLPQHNTRSPLSLNLHDGGPVGEASPP